MSSVRLDSSTIKYLNDNKMSFLNEAKYRLTDKDAKKPPFFKKLQRISALIITAGTGMLFAPLAVAYGIGTVFFGIGIGIAAELTTKDKAETTAIKAEEKKVEKAKEEFKEVTKKPE